MPVFSVNTKMTYLPERNSLQIIMIFDLFQCCRSLNNLLLWALAFLLKIPLNTNYGMKHTSLLFLFELFTTTFIIHLSFYCFYNIKAIYF